MSLRIYRAKIRIFFGKITIFARKFNDRVPSMLFRTEVSLPMSPFAVCHDDVLLTLGSCFADHMGTRLARAGFRCDVNPLGSQYNPLSLARALKRLLDGHPFVEDELRCFPGEGWGSWMHHSSFSRSDRDEALEVMNTRLSAASAALRNGCTLTLTFGSAWVYRLCEDGNVVGNCHRQPDALFRRALLTVDAIVSCWQPLLHRLATEEHPPHIVFTVSPIRHLRDGAHGNRLSKAVLLLATEALLKIWEQEVGEGRSVYFPAYELLLDELRDYRFYADDMAHPSTMAEEYIWQRFCDMFFTSSTRSLIQRWEEIHHALEHRPLRPDSDEYRHFMHQTLLKIEAIKKEYPNFNVENEIRQCHILLNN